MTLKSNDLINTRNTLSKDITKFWTIIRNENIISSKTNRNYDLIALYEKIKKKSHDRVMIKLFIQAINMGYKNFDEFKKENNYEAIYELCEKNEQLVLLGKIQTLTTSAKKNKKLTEVFTFTTINKLKKELTLEINALTKKIADFNDNATLEVDDSLKDCFTF